LLYRRLGGKPGTWGERRYTGAGTYTVETFKDVVADDYRDADGVEVLSFAQAQQRVLERRAKAGPYTVSDAIHDYLEHISHKAGAYDASLHARVHILPTLGPTKVEELTTARLNKWFQDLSRQGARKRTPKGEPQKFCEVDNTPEADAAAKRARTGYG
jgi:hypothetical protein